MTVKQILVRMLLSPMGRTFIPVVLIPLAILAAPTRTARSESDPSQESIPEYAAEAGWADWTREYSTPVGLAREFIRRTSPLWNPVTHVVVHAVYRIGGGIATSGASYFILESPKLFGSLVLGGPFGMGATISKDALMAVIEGMVKTPQSTCTDLAKSTIAEGLREYDVAYETAQRCKSEHGFTEVDARRFLLNRWGFFKLSAARALANESRDKSYTPTDQATEAAAHLAIGEMVKEHLRSIGASDRIPITLACSAIKDAYDIVERSRLGLADYLPYQEFMARMEYINRMRSEEIRRVTSDRFLIVEGGPEDTRIGLFRGGMTPPEIRRQAESYGYEIRVSLVDDGLSTYGLLEVTSDGDPVLEFIFDAEAWEATSQTLLSNAEAFYVASVSPHFVTADGISVGSTVDDMEFLSGGKYWAGPCDIEPFAKMTRYPCLMFRFAEGVPQGLDGTDETESMRTLWSLTDLPPRMHVGKILIGCAKEGGC